jgi:hypothetical protein
MDELKNKILVFSILYLTTEQLPGLTSRKQDLILINTVREELGCSREDIVLAVKNNADFDACAGCGFQLTDQGKKHARKILMERLFPAEK